MLSALLPALLLAGASLPGKGAALPNDPLTETTRLPAPGPHWAWVNDVVFPHMSDGQALLIDGDSGKFLGMLSTGFGFNGLVLPRDGKVIYSPEIYFSRGVRGERTDVITLYDPSTLSPISEIGIPAKRSTNMPRISNAQLTDDDRFLLVYNFNPSQSLTVVDMQARKFVGEIETPGCALVFITGNRSFFSLCADGSLLDVRMDDSGKAASSQRTKPLLDVKTDVVMDKGVRAGNTWFFTSKGGVVYPIETTPKGPQLGTKWPLVSDAERAQQWRPGGLQPFAVHADLKRFYAVMHQGNADTYKDPGKEAWVFDLATKKRVQRLTLANLSTSIQVTRDPKPLLFSAFADGSTTDIYDALSGQHLRAVESIGTTPTLIMTP
jgi:methylamine dehydrogenase heavy chain